MCYAFYLALSDLFSRALSFLAPAFVVAGSPVVASHLFSTLVFVSPLALAVAFFFLPLVFASPLVLVVAFFFRPLVFASPLALAVASFFLPLVASAKTALFRPFVILEILII